MTILRSIWILILLPIAFFFIAPTASAQEATVVDTVSAKRVEPQAIIEADSDHESASTKESFENGAASNQVSLDHEAIITPNPENKRAVEEALNAAYIYTNGAGSFDSTQALGNVWVGTGEMVSVAHVLRRGINLGDFRRTCNCEERGAKISPPILAPVSTISLSWLYLDHLPNDYDLKQEIHYLAWVGDFNFLLSGILFALIVFFSSWYLRFRSGIAPGYLPVIS